MKKALLSLVATGAIAIGTVFFKDGAADIAWRIIHAHGVFPYFVIFFSFWSLLTSLSEQWKPNRLMLLPAFIGAYGFLWEHGHAFADILEFMSGTWEISDLKGFVTAAVRSIALPIEILLLGTGLSLILFTITTCVAAFRSNKRS